MKLSHLVLKSMQKNMKHYFLYFFALIFSVTLYFSFETLQHNKSVLEATKAGSTAAAGFGAATYMLYFIVLFFVLYANHLFIKRRSKEIGLYQLIGMTKGLVTRLIAFENILLFGGAVIIGMGVGLLSSRLFAMILLKVLKYEAVVNMTFSMAAIEKTLIVFGILLVVILAQMAILVRKTSLLSLFTASKQADERVKRFSWFQMALGAFGLALIIFGYYRSSILFTVSTTNLLVSMVVILVTTIGGTYFVFRFSVAFVLNLIRLRKKGHLKLADVLALTPIMHRMKSNAKSLTLITVLTAVSLAITTLSYISYYSAETSSKSQVPGDYVVVDGREDDFLAALDGEGIEYKTQTLNITSAMIDMTQIFPADIIDQLQGDTMIELLIIPINDYKAFNNKATIEENEIIIAGYNGYMSNIMPLEAPFDLTLVHEENTFNLNVKAVEEESIIAWRISGGGYIAVVTEELFNEIEALNEVTPVGNLIEQQTIVNLDGATKEQYDLAEKLYKTTGANILFEHNEEGPEINKLSSLKASVDYNISLYGTTIFTTAFLGLAFLLATGSILYFKQMSEADEEMASYEILRKIGFTEQELVRGIIIKQLFNFGVPLVIGLLHSYFAVKSGWFLFGTELTAPLLITMALYIGMYIVFAALTIKYYKKVIKHAL